MKGNFFKTIFILLVVTLLIIAIQNTFLKKEEKNDSVNNFKNISDEKVISTNLRIGI